MHFTTFVAVDIGKYPVNKKTDKEIKVEIERLLSDQTNLDKNNIMIQCHIGYLRSLTNSFARAVNIAVEHRLEPYCECTENEEYLEFYDETEQTKQEYETGGMDCIKLRSGAIVPCYAIPKYCIKDGKVYQKEWGPLHHEKRTKKSKRMIALPQYPYKKLYRSFQEFAEEHCGLVFNEKYNAYGRYYNVNSFWDWYRIGGRWPCNFLVKEDCEEYSEGYYDWDYKLPTPPEGYKWASAARKKDIQWDAIIEYRKKRMEETYKSLRDAFKKKELPQDQWHLRLGKDGIYNFYNLALYLDGESFEENQKRRGYLIDSDYIPYPCYYVDHKTWYVKDNLWDDSVDDSAWKKEVRKFYDSISDDTVLVNVDCHD